MSNTSKINIILKYWQALCESEKVRESDLKEQGDNESLELYANRLFLEILTKYNTTKSAQSLFDQLGINGTFQVTFEKETNSFLIKYKDEYLDPRFDLKNHSPMGFGGGGSSSWQMALAVLARATKDDTIALTYYEQYANVLLPIIEKKKEISQVDVIRWVEEQKQKERENPVKYVCKQLDMTQKELAEDIKVSEGTVNRWAAKPQDIPAQTIRMFDLLIENRQLQEKLEKASQLKKLIQEL